MSAHVAHAEVATGESDEVASEAIADGEASPTRIEAAWFDAEATLGERGRNARAVAMQLGAHNIDGISRALIAPGPGDETLRTELAAEFAPDLPAAQMARAGERWANGQRGEALSALFAAVAAVPRHIESRLWLTGSVLLLLTGALIVASLAFLALGLCWVARSAMHDLGDLVAASTPAFARFGFLAALLLLPAALGEGVAGVALVAFAIAFTYGSGRLRVALGTAAVLLVLSLGPLAAWTGRSLVALEGDPVAAAVQSIVEERATPVERELLEANAGSDELAAFALAVDARRRGDDAAARARYEDLLVREPADGVARANLGTLLFEAEDFEGAIAAYEEAARHTASPVLLYDLSQAYGRVFRMEEFELALSHAQALDHRVVAMLSAHASEISNATGSAGEGGEAQSGAHTFVSDLPFPMERVARRLVDASTGEALPRELLAPLAPGWLGAWETLALAFAGAAALALMLAARFDASSQCTRCGARICGRCDGGVWSEDTCEVCHRFFADPDATDPTLRSARLERLRRRALRNDRLASASAFLVPGAGGLLAERPSLGLVALALFAWAIGSLWTLGALVAEPLAMGSLAPVSFAASGLFAAFSYLLLAGLCVVIRRRQVA